MNFEDICWLDSLFEEMMIEARKAKRKNEIITIIHSNHSIIKEQKLDLAKGALHNC